MSLSASSHKTILFIGKWTNKNSALFLQMLENSLAPNAGTISPMTWHLKQKKVDGLIFFERKEKIEYISH